MASKGPLRRFPFGEGLGSAAGGEGRSNAPAGHPSSPERRLSPKRPSSNEAGIPQAMRAPPLPARAKALHRCAKPSRMPDPVEPRMPLAENVHRLRVTDGKTIEDVADAAHLSASLVASIENGRRSVPQKAVRALAAHFGVSVETLLR